MKTCYSSKVNWIQMQIEAVENEKAEMNVDGLGFVDQELVEEANVGIEHAKFLYIREGRAQTQSQGQAA
ncbi:hypothetical protein RYX36_031935 [Vicia faba]